MYAFAKNLDLSHVIKNLMVKCDYDFNGCKTVVKFDNSFNAIYTHMKSCSYKLCVKCRLSSSDDHNCFQLMIIDRNEWKEKCQQNDLLIKELEHKLTEMMGKVEDEEEVTEEESGIGKSTMESRRYHRFDNYNARVVSSLKKMF